MTENERLLIHALQVARKEIIFLLAGNKPRMKSSATLWGIDDTFQKVGVTPEGAVIERD